MNSDDRQRMTKQEQIQRLSDSILNYGQTRGDLVSAAMRGDWKQWQNLTYDACQQAADIIRDIYTLAGEGNDAGSE